MKNLRNFNQYVLEKFVDSTGTVDKTLLDYYNGLYEKWVNGTLTPQEEKDYQNACQAKIYYIYEDKNSDAYKKLISWEKKASDESRQRDLALKASQLDDKSLPERDSEGLMKVSGIKPFKQFEKSQSVGTLKAYKPIETTKKYMPAPKKGRGSERKGYYVYTPTMKAFHEFLNTIEVPFEKISFDLGIQTKKPMTKTNWRTAISNWFNKIGNSISDRLEKFNDWLFPEKTEVEKFRDQWKGFTHSHTRPKGRDLKSTLKK